ncbi:MAG: hypothetical protein U0174_14175 [Polyangiaceae bacterium]
MKLRTKSSPQIHSNVRSKADTKRADPRGLRTGIKGGPVQVTNIKAAD